MKNFIFLKNFLTKIYWKNLNFYKKKILFMNNSKINIGLLLSSCIDAGSFF